MNTTQTVPTHTGRANLGDAQRAMADAVFSVITDLAGVEQGYCVAANCGQAAVNTNGNGVQGSHVLPAREGHAYVGHTIPTCAGHNGPAEGRADWMPVITKAVETVISLTPADTKVLAANYREAVKVAAANMTIGPAPVI